MYKFSAVILAEGGNPETWHPDRRSRCATDWIPAFGEDDGNKQIPLALSVSYHQTRVNIMRKLSVVFSGAMLDEEFLKPLGLTNYRLAKDIGVPPQHIGEIVAGRRSITADTDLRLSRYFGLTDGYWLRGQTRYHIEIAFK